MAKAKAKVAQVKEWLRLKVRGRRPRFHESHLSLVDRIRCAPDVVDGKTIPKVSTPSEPDLVERVRNAFAVKVSAPPIPSVPPDDDHSDPVTKFRMAGL